MALTSASTSGTVVRVALIDRPVAYGMIVSCVVLAGVHVGAWHGRDMGGAGISNYTSLLILIQRTAILH